MAWIVGATVDCRRKVDYMEEPALTDLLRRLVQAESTPAKGEAAAAEVLADWFARQGVDCAVDRWDGKRANAFARVKSTGERPALLFVTHLDVVSPGEEEWTNPPFAAVEQNGRIYGRGTTDMKGGIAAVAEAIREVVHAGTALKGDILFAATAGEETDSEGVVRFVEGHEPFPPLAGIVVPEPTDMAVITAHRGLFWLKITTRGRAVHSSAPERGINAIGSMRHVLDALEQYEVPFERHPRLGPCSMSVNTIRGGEAMNIVPDRCTLGVDIRTLPGQNHEAIRSDLERMLAGLKGNVPAFDAELTVERSVGAMETDPDCPFVRTFCSAIDVDLTNVVSFTTDAPHLTPLGAPIVVCGPGKGQMCHQVDEFITIDDLHIGVEGFRQVILDFLT